MDTLESLRLAPFALDDEALAWVRRTLAGLDTETKLRQLFNLASHADDAPAIEALAAQRAGGITRFGSTDLARAWQATRTLLERAEIPPLISGDIEGGAIGMQFGTRLPNQLGLAATGSLAANRAAVEVLAREARCLGYNWSFTPVVDINAAFRSAIVATRSYGSDVETILAHARVNVQTFQAHGIAATAKHWPGEGYDDRDQHLVTTINPLDETTWQARFGRLYRGLIEAGVMSVMSAHIAWPAYARAHGAGGLEACRPASISRLLNQRLLREELGFNGLIVSDATGMAGLGSWAERAEFVPQVIENGCDVLLFPADMAAEVGCLQAALRSGALSERRVEEAVTRVLGLKAALGLHRQSLDERLPPLERARTVVGCAAHATVAREVAGRSVTLVKDVQRTLPLHPERHRRVVIVSDPQRSGFALQSPLPLHIDHLLHERGFVVRAYDELDPPNPDNCDLVLYVLAQESLLTVSHVYLDWVRLQGGLRTSMRRFWHELPCVLISFGHPYYLYDAPRMPCVINAYSAIAPVQAAVVRRLLGEEAFTGIGPVDATCGLPDAMY